MAAYQASGSWGTSFAGILFHSVKAIERPMILVLLVHLGCIHMPLEKIEP